MWSLFRCRGASLVSPYERNVDGGSRLLCSFLFSSCREFSSAEAVQARDVLERKGQKINFTVSYLVNSCGLSPESAQSRAKYVQFTSPEKPDSVIKLLKKYGFSRDQIAKVINSYPRILIANADRVLVPKLEWIGSIGLLGEDRTQMITYCPKILSTSLHNSIIPSYNDLTSLLTPEEVVKTLKRSPRLLSLVAAKYLASKVSILSSHGVPQAHIRTLIKTAPRILSYSAEKFEDMVEKAIGLGVKKSNLTFMYAISLFCKLHELNWEYKINMYKSLGWSEDDILTAFRGFPLIMGYSEEKIRKAMEFYVKEMGLSPSHVAKTPVLMGLSLEKRVKPRCSVVKILLSQGLLKNDAYSLFYMMSIGEKEFMDRFVTKHCKEVPQLLTVFPGNLGSKAKEKLSL